MTGAVSRWQQPSTAVARHHARNLTTIDQAAELAEATVDGINRVTQRAMFETMRTHLLKKQAEALAPDGAELYALIAVAGAMESARVIEDVRRRIGW